MSQIPLASPTSRFAGRRLAPLAALVLLVAGCASADLARRDGGGVGFETAAPPAAVHAEALALAEELGYPARERGGAVEVELADGPMTERPSRWLRVTAEPGGAGSVVTVTPSPAALAGGRAGVLWPADPGRRADTLNPAFTFAEALAGRL